MIQLNRHNSWTELINCPQEAWYKLARHLSIPIEYDEREQKRFGWTFWHEVVPYENQLWGSLVHPSKLPAGLSFQAAHILHHYGYQYEYRDVREKPPEQMPLWLLDPPGDRWRPYQTDIHKKVISPLVNGVGVIDAPPRSGKTSMAMRAIDIFGQPALYIAPSLSIVKQTYDRMLEAFGDDYVARLDGEAKDSEKDISKHIVVATTASAAKLSREWYNTRGMLIIDESHHNSSQTIHTINDLASNIYHRLCFTGTHFRTADDTMAMHAICSHVIGKVDRNELIQQKYLAPSRITFIPTSQVVGGSNYRQSYQLGIVDHEERNEKICKISTYFGDRGQQVIVLVNRRKHAQALGDEIPDSKVVMGGTGALTNETIVEFRQNEFPVLIGTSVIGEGVDLPNASVLIYGVGNADSVSMIQAYYRPMTYQDNKPFGQVYDFSDTHNRTLSRHGLLRYGFAQKHFGDCVGSL